MRVLLSLLFLCIGLHGASAQDASPAAGKAQVQVQRIAQDFVGPRYERLHSTMQAQADAWRRFCGAPSQPGVDTLDTAFRDAVLAWSSVNLVRYGPVSEDFRYERIDYWPERRNEVARGLATLLAVQEPVRADGMKARSVAAQGLPVLERLLHEEGAREQLVTGESSGRRCEIGQAVSDNLATIASEIRDGWSALVAQLGTADEAALRQAATRMATDLLTVYQVVGDQKLDGPLGGSAEEARPKAAQYWRSGLSGPSIAASLGAAAELESLVLGPDNEAVRSARDAAEAAAALSGPVMDLVTTNEGGRELLRLRNAVRQARDQASLAVPPALGVSVGFNSLDGD
jgi:predicted lipoprotein